MVKTSTALAKMDGKISMGKWLHSPIMVKGKGNLGMPRIRRVIVGFLAVIVFIPVTQAATNLTTTWSLTKLFTSLCGPLEDVDSGIRLHIVVSYVSTAVLYNCTYWISCPSVCPSGLHIILLIWVKRKICGCAKFANKIVIVGRQFLNG